jgi:alpha-tubulin suppressor-like RCC1 family protein
MEVQPFELLLEEALDLDLPSLKALCETSSYFQDVLCENNYFWMLKFKKDFGFIPEEVQLWKEFYQAYQNTFIFGGPVARKEYPIKSKALSIGNDHQVLIDLNDEVWIWGQNQSGQLGLGDRTDRSQPTHLQMKAKQISAGDRYTLLIDFENKVWCWGSNQYYQLGLINPNEERLKPVELGMLAKTIVAGPTNHSFLIDLSGKIWGWGRNQWNQVHPMRKEVIERPTQLQFVGKKILPGIFFSLLLDFQDNLWIWGYLGLFGLGQDNVNPFILNRNVIDVAAGNAHIIIIDSNQEVWTMGNNRYGQLGLGLNIQRAQFQRLNKKAKKIAAAAAQSMILDENGKIWVWGSNRNQRLGIEYGNVISTPHQLEGIIGNEIAAGIKQTGAIGTNQL